MAKKLKIDKSYYLFDSELTNQAVLDNEESNLVILNGLIT